MWPVIAAAAMGGASLYEASQYGKGYRQTANIPMDARTKALDTKYRTKVDSNYKLAEQGGWTVNLAAPIISGLKAQAQQARLQTEAGIMARGAQTSNSNDFAPGSSLTRIMASSGQQQIAGQMAPVDARARAMGENYQSAMQGGKSVYDMERQQALRNYEAEMARFLQKQIRSAKMGAAWGGLGGNMAGAIGGGK